MRRALSFLPYLLIAALSFAGAQAVQAADVPSVWSSEWPDTDFSKLNVDPAEIFSGGPPKDGIPSIDRPVFVDVAAFAGLGDDEPVALSDDEPVVAFSLNGDARAYPLRVLMWHEIVNDTVGGVPVTVTYCPLCNSAIVFDRRHKGAVLDFGTTGKLRNSDLVMYDRQTESWWQQFTGEGLLGHYAGDELTMLASRLDSFSRFRDRFPNGRVLVPNDPGLRDYGRNPYVGYDNRFVPYGFFQGPFPEGIRPMMRVVAVGEKAWSLPLLINEGTITDGDLTIHWESGQNSALDAETIAKGRDVGNVTVKRNGKDAIYDVTFAFVFHAFYPKGELITEAGGL
ncbi:MAG: DUF3179 domain-containing protein [Magnetovibrionaceae bacterium]